MNDSIMEVISKRFIPAPGINRKPLYKKLVAICRNNHHTLTKHHSQILLDLIKASLEDECFKPVLNEMVKVLKNSPVNYDSAILQLADYNWFESAEKEEISNFIEKLILSDWN